MARPNLWRPEPGAPGPRSSRRRHRLPATLALLLALFAGFVAFGPPASAHHSEISGSADCDGVVSWTARAWNGSTVASRTNPSVKVWYRIGSGPAVTVATGAFNSGNNFQFSGTFAWPDPSATQLTLYVQEQANWGNGAGISSPRSVTVRLPTDCPAPTITVDADCDAVTITSSKDLSNVIWRAQDGTEGKVDRLSGTTYELPNDPANPIVAVWVRSGTAKLESGDPAPSGSFTDVGTYRAVPVPEGCGGVPQVSLTTACVDGDGRVTLTLLNAGGFLPVTFVVTNPVTGGQTTKVVDPGGSATVVLGSLPDGTWTIPVTADGSSLNQQVTVDCDRPGVPNVEVTEVCVEGDGTVTVRLSTTGGDLPVTFVVTDPVTQAETTREVAPGESTSVTFTGLADGTYTIGVTADGTPLNQTVVVACDRPGQPGVTAEQGCTADGGEVTVTLTNTTPAGEGEPVTFVVTDPTGGSDRTVTVEAGSSTDIVFSGLADGDYVVDVTADGQPWGRISVEVDCRRPEVLGVLVECLEEGGEVLVLANDGPTPVELTVLVDGEELTTVVVPGDDLAAVVIPVAEDESVQVTVLDGDVVVAELEVTRDCEEPTPSTTTPPGGGTTAPPGAGTTLPPPGRTDIPTEVAGIQQTAGTLPRTGGDHARMIVAGLLLVAAGALLVLAAQQRRAAADDPLWRRL